uniref:Uncharacterized protein n=1 Tax=Spongospora subterranea TaxID=70186 RepID=A0A0H5RSX0_9EUKA|eukprot:CRZ11814.1 hypothetical protein [Spongospora subterranea]
MSISDPDFCLLPPFRILDSTLNNYTMSSLDGNADAFQPKSVANIALGSFAPRVEQPAAVELKRQVALKVMRTTIGKKARVVGGARRTQITAPRRGLLKKTSNDNPELDLEQNEPDVPVLEPRLIKPRAAKRKVIIRKAGRVRAAPRGI